MSLPEHIVDAVLEDLVEGYGVEDVAVRRGIPIEKVRALVDKLREQRLLSVLYAREEGE